MVKLMICCMIILKVELVFIVVKKVVGNILFGLNDLVICAIRKRREMCWNENGLVGPVKLLPQHKR